VVVPRHLIAFLILALCVLLVGFAVVAVGYGLAVGMDDLPGACVLWWIAVACLLLFLVAFVLLVIALGLNYLHEGYSRDETDDHPEVPGVGRSEKLE
jgi:hypothetical protein